MSKKQTQMTTPVFTADSLVGQFGLARAQADEIIQQKTVPKLFGCHLPYCAQGGTAGCNALKQVQVCTSHAKKAACVSLVNCSDKCPSRKSPPEGPCKCAPTEVDCIFQRQGVILRRD